MIQDQDIEMKALPALVLFLFVIFGSTPATAQSQEDAVDGTLIECATPDQLEWLLGAWETTGGRQIFRESWVRLSGATWEGVGHVLDAGSREVMSEESLRMVGMRGGLFYLAKVEHNDLPIAFAASECSSAHVAFENPDHDFPKRIVYRRVDSDRITVDVDDGQGQGFRLDFARTE